MSDAGPESRNQLLVAVTIVAVMCVLGVALIVAPVITKDTAFAATGIGAMSGALATALNAPSGIGKVISAAKAPPANPTPPPPGGQPAEVP